MRSRSGHCQCGRVRYEFAGEPTDVSFCHCSICRRLTGSAFGAYVEVPNSSLRVTQGVENLKTYDVTAKLDTRFCASCGVRLFTTHSDFEGKTYISLGTLTDAEDIVPQYHQFVASKAKWHQIAEGLPQYQGWD